MALLPDYYGVLLFGVVTAGSFLVPGWKYYRQRARSRQVVEQEPASSVP
jgi:hypothetical protein